MKYVTPNKSPIFKNISNYKERQDLISKLNENILVEANKINQLFKDIELTKIKDIYGVDTYSSIGKEIQEIKCW